MLFIVAQTSSFTLFSPDFRPFYERFLQKSIHFSVLCGHRKKETASLFQTKRFCALEDNSTA